MRKASLLALMSFLVIFTGVLLAQEKTIDVDVTADGDGDAKVIKIRKGGDIEEIILNENDDLDLTEEQRKKFKKIELAFEKDIISTKNELEVAQLELDVEMDEDNPNIGKINGLIDDIHKKEAEIEKKRIASELKKRDLLTDEQKKNWKLRGPHKIRKEIIMLKDGEHDMMWFGDHGDFPPAPPKIKKEKKIITK
jgi:Spy/CpxP family protein refolding chaperone